MAIPVGTKIKVNTNYPAWLGNYVGEYVVAEFPDKEFEEYSVGIFGEDVIYVFNADGHPLMFKKEEYDIVK